MKTDWQLHDEIFALACRLIGYEVVNGTIYYQGEVMPYNEYESATLEETIPYDGDEIDAVLVFGDGTVELHFKNEEDAYNWGEFSGVANGVAPEDSVLQKVVDVLIKMM
jgi:hypothetical protein